MGIKNTFTTTATLGDSTVKDIKKVEATRWEK